MPRLAGAMIFKRKGSFFLNFDKNAPDKPAVVAPIKAVEPKGKAGKAAKAAKDDRTGKQATVAPSEEAPLAAAAAAGGTAAQPVAEEGRVLTTAEAIAAELRREQENRPAPAVATFAPEQLIPSGALPRRRRKAGANLGVFKEIAGSLLRS